MWLSPLVHLHPSTTPPPPIPPNALALPHEPSAAFGDGSHPTTRLCAGAVDLLCRLNSPKSFLDVGTGSGILARIARARGAHFVVGTDIDSASLAAARRGAALDRHPHPIIHFENHSPQKWGPTFDLVVANILEGTLRDLAPALSQALAPGGHLLLSGFTPLQIPTLRQAFTESEKVWPLKWLSHSTLEGWALAHLVKQHPHEN